MDIIQVMAAKPAAHSITLLIGALGWVKLPSQPVEVLIAFSILISAIHAIRPVFPGKEMYVAAGFGLIHGLAFASVLSNLNLSSGTLALSILGFNLGIELMQLLIALITIPWLIILSKNKIYTPVKVTGALMAAVLSIAWIVQRLFQQQNFITTLVDNFSSYSIWLIFLLAVFAIASMFVRNKKLTDAKLKMNM